MLSGAPDFCLCGLYYFVDVVTAIYDSIRGSSVLRCVFLFLGFLGSFESFVLLLPVADDPFYYFASLLWFYR